MNGSPEAPWTTGGGRPSAAGIAFFVYLATAGVLLVAVLHPFLTALLLAAVVSVWLAPLHDRFIARWDAPKLGASLLIIGLIVGVVLPLVMLGTMLVSQLRVMLVDLADHIARPLEVPALQGLLGWLAEQWQVPVDVVPDRIRETALRFLQNIVAAASRNLGSLAGGLANVFLQFGVFLFSVFTFLIHRRELVSRFKRLSPLEDTYEDQLLEIFRGFSRGLVFGGVMTSALQGVVVTAGYLVTGVPQAIFWGTMTAILSFVPIVGSALVWVPITLGVWAEGRSGAALALAVYNVVVTGSVDNIARPFLIGRGSQMSTLMLFLTVLGGLITFGFPGLLIGPVAAAFFFALAEVMERRRLGQTPACSTPAGGAAAGGPGDATPLL